MKATPQKPRKKNLPPDVAGTVATVYGCKWSLKIFEVIQRGISRPGAIEKALPGLTTRVQSYYFHRMIELGVVRKQSYPEIPPRVEYEITDYGRRVLVILDSIVALQRELEAGQEIVLASSTPTRRSSKKIAEVSSAPRKTNFFRNGN